MIQIFLAALDCAACAMLTAFAWLLAVLGFLACVAILIFLLAAAFDAGTAVLVWWWKLVKHKPRGKLERILMGERDGV